MRRVDAVIGGGNVDSAAVDLDVGRFDTFRRSEVEGAVVDLCYGFRVDRVV